MIWNLQKGHVDYGRFLARQGEKYGVERVLNFFFSSTSSMGWGKLEMVKFEDSEVVFRTVPIDLRGDSRTLH
nr:hypothetical protein [Candidatus Freyrarchaeum guaymaensis]